MATAPAPRLFDLPVYADHGFDYWRQDEAGRVVLGGWRNLDPGAEVGTSDVLHEGIQAKMEAFIRRFPALADVPITHRWSGTMGFVHPVAPESQPDGTDEQVLEADDDERADRCKPGVR